MIEFACPHCNKALSMPEDLIGKKALCTYCHGAFMITMLDASSESGEEEPGSAHGADDENSPVVRERVAKDLEAACPEQDLLRRHAVYEALIVRYYEQRHQGAAALAHCIQACLQHIALAPRAKQALEQARPNSPLPTHMGFDLLSTIREKQGKYSEVVRLAQQAKSQGWTGDWDKRIDRCKKTSIIRKVK